MHEMSLVQSLLTIVDEHAQRHGFERVNSLKLVFGKLSSVEPKALEFAFDVLSRDTRAEGAHLIFDIKPVSIYCTVCESTTSSQMAFDAKCSACGSVEVMLAGGTEELQLIEMDVD